MSLPPTGNDEMRFCGARLQACRVDSRVDVVNGTATFGSGQPRDIPLARRRPATPL
jgi:hypothetical protein